MNFFNKIIYLCFQTFKQNLFQFSPLINKNQEYLSGSSKLTKSQQSSTLTTQLINKHAVNNLAYMQINEQAIAKLDEIIELFREQDTVVLDNPVDYIHIPLPDYLSIVQRPFCLNQLQDNLQYGKYQYFYEFIHDFCLILNNAREYNYGDEPFLLSLDNIEKRFCEVLKKNDIEIVNVITMRAIGQIDPQSQQIQQNKLSIQRLRMIKQKIQMLDIPSVREQLIMFLKDHNMEQMLRGNEINLKLNLFNQQDLLDLEILVNKLFNQKYKSVI